MTIQSLLGLLGVGLILGLAATQVAKATENRKKKVPVKIPVKKRK
ncbi:MAG: hypothetical protein NXH75_01055 [Halobacteriovoraceae bacterium]|nr:hypothetical protein [Halobacteriovoraceae bacterium]